MKLLEEIANQVTKDDSPLWKEIAVDTLKKAVATVVVESIKAGIDLVKRERIRHDDYAFQQWKKAREEERKKAEEDSKKASSESSGSRKSSKKASDDEQEEKPVDKSEENSKGSDEVEEPEQETAEEGAKESEPTKKWLAL